MKTLGEITAIEILFLSGTVLVVLQDQTFELLLLAICIVCDNPTGYEWKLRSFDSHLFLLIIIPWL